jgi:hypothetical protein
MRGEAFSLLPETGRGTRRSLVEGPSSFRGRADPTATAFGGGPPPRSGEEN